MQLSLILEESPRYLERTMRQNVVLTVFHIQNIYHHLWKTVRTSLQCIVGLQSWGKGHEMEKNYKTNMSHSFPCFSNLFAGIGGKRNIKVWKTVRTTF